MSTFIQTLIVGLRLGSIYALVALGYTMNVCERIQVIDYGLTIAAGLPEEIAKNPKVIAAYLGE